MKWFPKRSKTLSMFFVLLFLMGVLSPAVFASGDPWYTAPFQWILDFLLNLLGGIHDPMDHVFYNGCGTIYDSTFHDTKGVIEGFQACVPRAKFGLFTQAQFDTVVYRGFFMFQAIAVFIVVSSVIKSGILLSLKNLSSTLKFEVTDVMVKTLIAIILLSQFFYIVGGLFKVNNMLVDYIRQDLQGQLVVTNGSPINANGNMASKGTVLRGDGLVLDPNQRIEFSDLQKSVSATTSPFARLTIVLVGKGVSIWWEVFYLQRKIMITLLIILAPLWICCMFYPMLHGVTLTAFKELWSQIVAQAIHAILFWGYLHIIDNQMTWFHAFIALILFIPISESVRFIFGATSESGGKLAMIGTLAGAGAMMNLTKGLASLGTGASNSLKESKGIDTSQKGGHNPRRSGGVGSGVGSLITGGDTGGGVSGGESRTSSAIERQVRARGALMAGVGSAMGGMGLGLLAGGLSPVGSFIGGQAGAKLGSDAGYRVGAGSVLATESLKDAFAKAAGKSGGSGDLTGSPFSGNMSEEEQDLKASATREKSGQRWGIVGEAVLGRGGFAHGENYGKQRSQGISLSPEKLQDRLRTGGSDSVYTVESASGSYLATRDEETGGYVQISNLGKGNSEIKPGQTVVSGYNVQQGNGGGVRLTPMKEKVIHTVTNAFEGDKPREEFINSSYAYTETGKSAYNGKTIDPHEFIRPSQSQEVDMRRKNS